MDGEGKGQGRFTIEINGAIIIGVELANYIFEFARGGLLPERAHYTT